MMLKAKQIISVGVHNTLAEGTIITGNVKADEDFRIDGTVEGDIVCNGKIVVGVKGTIIGQINCANAELMGKITGMIHTSGHLSLKSTAIYTGDAYTKTMEIEPGAVFNGSCTMTE